ncbi:MAG: glycosyltransferase family 4 protein [Melioribacteraceae bacterium]
MYQKILFRITTVPISLKYLLNGQLNFMQKYYNVFAVSSSGKDLEFIENLGIRTEVIEMTRSITPFKDIIAIVKMFFLFKKEKPFIVHTHTPKAGLIGMVAAKLAGVPNKLHTVAGLPLMESRGLKRIVLKTVEKFTYYLSDRVYPNSLGLKEFILKSKLCDKAKLKVIGNGSSNGINTEYFSNTVEIIEKSVKLKNKLDITDESIVLCYIGRIVKDKGINELISAFNGITIPNLKLLLLGEEESELDPISENSKIILLKNSNIIKCGWQNDVRAYLAITDIFVFPSYREGFPNVVLQAGAMGIPCIVSNINGCNEIIINNKNGIIIEPKNEIQLKKAIIQLVEDTSLRKELALNARAMIVERFEQHYVWNEILNEYKTFEKSC